MEFLVGSTGCAARLDLCTPKHPEVSVLVFLKGSQKNCFVWEAGRGTSAGGQESAPFLGYMQKHLELLKAAVRAGPQALLETRHTRPIAPWHTHHF